MKRHILFFISCIFMFSCAKEEVSELQADYFIKFYGGHLYNQGHDIIESNDQNVMITGSARSETSGDDIVLMKFDDYGNEMSEAARYDFNGDDIGYKILSVDDGYLIAGSIENASGDMDAILFKTDSRGNRTGDDYIFSYGGDEIAVDIEERDDGGYFVVGYSADLSTTRKSFFVLGLDEDFSGVKITASPSIGEEFLRIFRTRPGEYTAVGNRYSGENFESSRFFAVKLNETGNIFDLTNFNASVDQEIMADAASPGESTIIMLGTAKEAGSSRSRLVVKKVVGFQESWTRYIDESVSLEGKSIFVKSDGSILVGANKIEGTDKNIVVYFLDNQGSVLSSKEYGGSGNQMVDDLLFHDGSLLILGRNEFEGNSMISLIKTDENGNLWE